MLYFNLPQSVPLSPTNDIRYYTTPALHAPPMYSFTLANYLNQTKEKIDKCHNEWDTYKKYTNPYEYINTHLPSKSRPISKYKPLSRSYFKMVEIIDTFHLDFGKHAIKTFHLAEGPGGFIQAIVNARRIEYAVNQEYESSDKPAEPPFLDASHDTYTGMTILRDTGDANIPGWKSSAEFLAGNPNVSIETGSDGTGNILSLENFHCCVEKYGLHSMDFITADGGFDFSMDFNRQENSIADLLFAQIAYAICLQKKGGHFVLKIFDAFMPHTVDLLYILSTHYAEVFMTKPHTSRYANSEKYIVCKHFLGASDDIYETLSRVFIDVLHKPMVLDADTSNETNNNAATSYFLLPETEPVTNTNTNTVPGTTTSHQLSFVRRFLTFPLPIAFIARVEELNAIFGKQQIDNIIFTFSLIESKHKADKIDNLVKTNIQKCIQWCMRHNVPFYNVGGPTTNQSFSKHPPRGVYYSSSSSSLTPERGDNRFYDSSISSLSTNSSKNRNIFIK